MSTPGGTLIVIVRRVRTRPSPAHSWQGCGIVLPNPWQVGQGRDVMTCPRKDRCTCWTSPRPLHITQGTASLFEAVPLPPQVAQPAAVSTVMSRVSPKTAAESVIWIRIIASWPRRARVRGPRCPPPPPKNASMMSPKSKPWEFPPPLLLSGSPPRSNI
ncbi:unannotated protein [freshwater metagenome]|uniref:Unannotated protein n=1 Tax=freshwater metagenome TaxID=449393 RepID=A0A6J6Q3F3_9ZZZZ